MIDGRLNADLTTSQDGAVVVKDTRKLSSETERQILIAAETLFLDNGYDKVSLDAIAAMAGVTRGAIHWHFKTKHGLLLALRDKGQEPFRRLADELSSDTGTASIEKLGDLLCEMLSELERDPRQRGLLRVTLRLDLTLADRAEHGGTSFYEEMASIMLRIFDAIERDAGLAFPWTPQMAASMLSATIVGLVIEWALEQQDLRLSTDGATFIRMILSSWRW